MEVTASKDCNRFAWGPRILWWSPGLSLAHFSSLGWTSQLPTALENQVGNDSGTGLKRSKEEEATINCIDCIDIDGLILKNGKTREKEPNVQFVLPAARAAMCFSLPPGSSPTQVRQHISYRHSSAKQPPAWEGCGHLSRPEKWSRYTARQPPSNPADSKNWVPMDAMDPKISAQSPWIPMANARASLMEIRAGWYGYRVHTCIHFWTKHVELVKLIQARCTSIHHWENTWPKTVKDSEAAIYQAKRFMTMVKSWWVIKKTKLRMDDFQLQVFR